MQKIILTIILIFSSLFLLAKENLASSNSFYHNKNNSIYYYDDLVQEADIDSFEALTHIYAKDKNNFYCKGNKMEVDVNSFVVLDEYYAKDKNNVYYSCLIMENTDPSSFEILNISETIIVAGIERKLHLYSKDKNNLYFLGRKMDINLDSVELYNGPYAKDKNNVFFLGEKITKYNLDSETFEVLRYYPDIIKDKNGIYTAYSMIEHSLGDIGKVENIQDAKSFVILKDQNENISNYAKDKNAFYFCKISSVSYAFFCECEKFYDIDNNSFSYNVLDEYKIQIENKVYQGATLITTLENKNSALENINSYYYKDNQSIYYTEGSQEIKKMSDVDYDSFKIVESKYAKDKNHVYFQGVKIQNADPLSFIMLDRYEPFTKDKNHVYYYDKTLVDADPNSFSLFELERRTAIYSKDRNNAYYFDKKIEGNVDAKTFKGLTNNYAQDKNNIYYDGVKIDGGDGSTFELFPDNQYYTKDKNNIYCQGEVQKVDRQTFEILNETYARDKNNVYFRKDFYCYNVILSDIDPSTFEVVYNSTAYDKNYFLEEGRRTSVKSETKEVDKVDLIIKDIRFNSENKELEVEYCNIGSDNYSLNSSINREKNYGFFVFIDTDVSYENNNYRALIHHNKELPAGECNVAKKTLVDLVQLGINKNGVYNFDASINSMQKNVLEINKDNNYLTKKVEIKNFSYPCIKEGGFKISNSNYNILCCDGLDVFDGFSNFYDLFSGICFDPNKKVNNFDAIDDHRVGVYYEDGSLFGTITEEEYDNTNLVQYVKAYKKKRERKIKEFMENMDDVMNTLKEVIAEKIMEEEKKLVQNVNQELINKMRGRVLLQVEKGVSGAEGQAWWVDIESGNKFYMKDGKAAYDILRSFGQGISFENLARIPIGFDSRLYNQLEDSDKDGLPDSLEEAINSNPQKKDSDGDSHDDKTEIINGFIPNGSGTYSYDLQLINKLGNGIFLQVAGEIYNGEAWLFKDGFRYYIDPRNAYSAMGILSTGITNENIRQIQVGEFTTK